MSDFGSEVASSTLKTVSQAAELMAKLFKFLLTRAGNKSGSHYDDKLKKQEAINLKALNKERAVSLQYAGRSGYVAAKKLQQIANSRNVKLYTPNIANMSDESFSKLCEKMKNRGMLFSAIKEEKSGTRIFEMFASDKEVFNEVLQKLEVDRLVANKNEKINDLLEKETLTAEEQEQLKELQHDKDVLLCKEVTDENRKNIDEVFANVADSKKDQIRTFDDTVNNFTDRGFQKNDGEPYYVCDRLNPSSYIEVRESKDIFHDKEYTKTNFTVYKDGIEQKSEICKGGNFNDARFEGRPRYYWANVRKEMKEKGGFSDDMVVFSNKKDFEKYQSLYEKSLKENTINIDADKNTNYRNFADIQKQLDEHLKVRGVAIQEGQLVDTKTKEPITKESVSQTTNIDDKVRLQESLVIAKQMHNYKAMAVAYATMTMTKSEYADALALNESPHGEDIDKIIATIKENEEKLLFCEKAEIELAEQRKDLSYVDAVNEVDTDRQIELHMLPPPEREDTLDRSELNEALDAMDTMEAYETEIRTRQEIKETIKPEKVEVEITKETTHIEHGNR